MCFETSDRCLYSRPGRTLKRGFADYLCRSVLFDSVLQKIRISVFTPAQRRQLRTIFLYLNEGKIMCLSQLKLELSSILWPGSDHRHHSDKHKPWMSDKQWWGITALWINSNCFQQGVIKKVSVSPIIMPLPQNVPLQRQSRVCLFTHLSIRRILL